jgi:hypothetical protein
MELISSSSGDMEPIGRKSGSESVVESTDIRDDAPSQFVDSLGANRVAGLRREFAS